MALSLPFQARTQLVKVWHDKKMTQALAWA